jgi:flagellar hook-length control protein FliK
MPITAPLPSLNASASPAAAPKPAENGADGGQFGATLSREIGQRTQASQDSANGANAPAPQEKPAAPADAKAARAHATEDAQDKDQDDAAAAATTAADPAAVAPAADMLAMVASINQLLKPGAAPDAAPAEAPQAVGGPGARKPGAATDAAAALAPALPGDAAARFAALMRAGQPAAQDKAATPARSTPGAAAVLEADAKQARAGVTAADPLSPSQSPGAAPSGAPSAAPTSAPSGAPTAAPVLLAAEHLAATAAPTAAPDAAAAQLLAAAQAQQLAPAAAQAAAQVSPASNYVPAQLGSTGWNDQVGQKIVWMVAGGEQSASLTLNPPDLGPMQVVLSVNGDQASVAFSSGHEEVRHALESAMPRLREMMGESGIALGSATVSTGMPDQRQAQGQWQPPAQGGARGPAAGNHTDDTPVPRVATRTTVMGGQGMVDTFA